MKLKVCGLKNADNILEVASLSPSYMGFIFWSFSPRNYTAAVLPSLSNKIKKTGVFVNATLEFVKEKVNTYNFQAVQLHGNESPSFCRDLKKTGIEVIKAFHMDGTFNFKQLSPYEAVTNYFLFDTKGQLPGGNGVAFDKKILYEYKLSHPFFLSGGISLESIATIKEYLSLGLPLYGVDVNSKFETQPGEKSIGLLKEFKQSLPL